MARLPGMPNIPGGGSRQQRAAELRAEDERRRKANRGAVQRESEQEEPATTVESTSDQQSDSGDEQPAEPLGTGPVGTGEYVVKQGDCIDSIAFEHGFFWETIWNDAGNAELRQARNDAFVLLPGDLVHIPEKRRKDEPGATEQHHRFRRRGMPSVFRLRVLRGGEPRANEPYSLTIDDTTHEGTTDADGRIEEVPIPPNANSGRLIVGQQGVDQETISLKLGGLDPISELTGVQGRLANLGYGCAVTGELDEATRAALAAFQKAQEMDPTGNPDSATRDKLLETHGS